MIKLYTGFLGKILRAGFSYILHVGGFPVNGFEFGAFGAGIRSLVQFELLRTVLVLFLGIGLVSGAEGRGVERGAGEEQPSTRRAALLHGGGLRLAALIIQTAGPASFKAFSTSNQPGFISSNFTSTAALQW